MLPWCEKDLAHLAEAGSAGDDPRQLPNATADATVLFSFFLKFLRKKPLHVHQSWQSQQTDKGNL